MSLNYSMKNVDFKLHRVTTSIKIAYIMLFVFFSHLYLFARRHNDKKVREKDIYIFSDIFGPCKLYIFFIFV